jgi:hypothetical protein
MGRRTRDRSTPDDGRGVERVGMSQVELPRLEVSAATRQRVEELVLENVERPGVGRAQPCGGPDDLVQDRFKAFPTDNRTQHRAYGLLLLPKVARASGL